MEQPRPPAPRPWLPVIWVLVVLVVVVFGGYLTAGALSVHTGRPLRVAGVVRIVPVSGWQPAGRLENPPGARLTRGNASLDVWVLESFGGSASGLAGVYERDALASEAERISASQPVATVSARARLSAVRFSYVGIILGRGESPVEGEVTAIVSSSGVGVVIDGWAAQGQLRYSLDDVHRMIDSLEVS
jgi:hypothetical protein